MDWNDDAFASASHCENVVATVNPSQCPTTPLNSCASSRPETCFTPLLRALDQPHPPGLCFLLRAANLRSLHEHWGGHHLLFRLGRRIAAMPALPPSTHLLRLYE